jgi:hypothetical protein
MPEIMTNVTRFDEAVLINGLLLTTGSSIMFKGFHATGSQFGSFMAFPLDAVYSVTDLDVKEFSFRINDSARWYSMYDIAEVTWVPEVKPPEVATYTVNADAVFIHYRGRTGCVLKNEGRYADTVSAVLNGRWDDALSLSWATT